MKKILILVFVFLALLNFAYAETISLQTPATCNIIPGTTEAGFKFSVAGSINAINATKYSSVDCTKAMIYDYNDQLIATTTNLVGDVFYFGDVSLFTGNYRLTCGSDTTYNRCYTSVGNWPKAQGDVTGLQGIYLFEGNWYDNVYNYNFVSMSWEKKQVLALEPVVSCEIIPGTTEAGFKFNTTTPITGIKATKYLTVGCTKAMIYDSEENLIATTTNIIEDEFDFGDVSLGAGNYRLTCGSDSSYNRCYTSAGNWPKKSRNVTGYQGCYWWDGNWYDNSYSYNFVAMNWEPSTPQPFILFSPPTPANGTVMTNTSMMINVIVKDVSAPSSFIWNWNGNNYSFYDNSLKLLMNFDKVAALGENSTKAVDFSKYEHNGAVHGATWTPSGKYNGAYQFDGVNDYIDIPTGNYKSSNITLSAWVMLNNYNHNSYIIDGKSANNFLTMIWYPVETGYQYMGLACHFGESYDWVKSSSLALINVWHHVVCVNNVTHNVLYVDGELVNKVQATAPMRNNTGFDIGTYGGAGAYFNGSIDEVRIWNRSLSADEVEQQYYSNLNKYDSDKWQFLSRPIFMPGNYTYYAFVNSSGKLNRTETRTISRSLTCTDNDGDGYAIEGGACGYVDCDDTNPHKYQYKIIWQDNDRDGFAFDLNEDKIITLNDKSIKCVGQGYSLNNPGRHNNGWTYYNGSSGTEDPRIMIYHPDADGDTDYDPENGEGGNGQEGPEFSGSSTTLIILLVGAAVALMLFRIRKK
jgi:hypothetical protein